MQEAKGGQARDKKREPSWCQFANPGQSGAAIMPSIGMFLEKSRQAQNMVTFAQVRFAPRLALFSQASNITS